MNQVSDTATRCWSHLFTVGGVGVVAAAIDLLCNDKSSLSDKDAAAVALSSLAESDKPRAVILDSQAALDELAALLKRWDYDVEGGGDQVRVMGIFRDLMSHNCHCSVCGSSW